MSEGLLGEIRHELVAIYSDVWLWVVTLVGIALWFSSGSFLYGALVTGVGAAGYIIAEGHHDELD